MAIYCHFGCSSALKLPRGLRVANPNSRGHATKRGLRVPNPNSRGHTTKRGLLVSNPNSRGPATKRGFKVKTYARGNNYAPSISNYGSLVRPDAQIVALHAHRAKCAPSLASPTCHAVSPSGIRHSQSEKGGGDSMRLPHPAPAANTTYSILRPVTGLSDGARHARHHPHCITAP